MQLSKASLRLLVSKELADVKHHGCRWAHSFPQTFMFHLHMATRHLAKALVVPSAPDISGASRSCHRTSSSFIPWAATSNHLQLASISASVSGPSSQMSMQATNCHARLPPEASICLAAGSPRPPSSHLPHGAWGCEVSESPPPHPCHHPARPGPHSYRVAKPGIHWYAHS